MNRSLNNSVWLVKGGDTSEIAKGIADSMAQRQAEQENRTPGQKTLDEAIKKVSNAKGFWETTTAGWDAVKTAATEPGAVGLGAAESAASMLPTMVGAGAGAVTGGGLGAGIGSVVPGVGTAAAGATGAVWGGRTGMVAGTTAVEAGAELEQMVLTDPQCSDCLVHAYVRLEAGAAGRATSPVFGSISWMATRTIRSSLRR